ncbi:putative ABC transport system ATP-binding protein [Streptohalobacillus salinus]|uniref:Putative ABC transport system ATP-binding protein n=1 Tax=Streptohalobacillus salinus TaxID=621096 RepID=A0A2V3WEJ2_9BACI|nr:ABC transporter ATP-binding protein [Streptohalobacillus salinus]PXW91514.1 putative ABC transport system ATP-binding protein [Streptohalobacillus salinus]
MRYPLETKQLTKRFKDGDDTIEVLNAVDFQLEQGSFTAVVGPSGSGKSTFLSIVGALLSADEGQLIVDGKDISTMKDQQLSDVRLKSMGFIFQSANLIPYLTVKDQLQLVATLNKQTKKQSLEKIKAMLDDVGLSHRINHYPHQLSGGEKQRVAIARAFINDPAVILADEPTANLDEERSKEIVALIKQEVKANNKAAIMVTHDESLLTYCDHVYEMDHGHLKQR